MNRLLLIIPALIVLALLLVLAVGLQQNPREVPSPLVGKPAPAFRLPVLGESALKLGTEQLPGQPVLVNVWASWCVACLEEHPLLLEVSRSGQARIIGLNYKDDEQDALGWLQKHGNPYYWSVQDRDGQVGINWGVYGVPETFVLDAQGVIRHKHIGPIKPEDWRTTLQPLLESLHSGGRAS